MVAGESVVATERREDTVAIPRQAITFAAALAVSLLAGVGAVLWNVTSASISVNERVAQLESFGPHSGERFTKADGDMLRREIQELRTWRQAHTEFGYEVVGRWDAWHQDHKRRLDLIEQKLEHLGHQAE